MRNARRITISTMGLIAGLAGLEHGMGETLQGDHAPAGIVFPSWPGSAFFSILGGEPAMSIIPNLLASGILTNLLSLVFIAWAILFVQRKHGGLGMILLSALILLVGGGFGPPLLGIILGAAASRMNAALPGRRTFLHSGVRRFIGRLWPWIFGLCVAAWLCLCPGISIMAYFFGIDAPTLVVAIITTAFGSLLLAILSGFARDGLAVEAVETAPTKVTKPHLPGVIQ